MVYPQALPSHPGQDHRSNSPLIVQAMVSPRALSAGTAHLHPWTVAACVAAFLLTVTALWGNMSHGSAGTVRTLLGRVQPMSALDMSKTECGATSTKRLRSWIRNATSVSSCLISRSQVYMLRLEREQV